MAQKCAYHTYLNSKTLNLAELTNLLKQDYAELIETSAVLRKGEPATDRGFQIAAPDQYRTAFIPEWWAGF